MKLFHHFENWNIMFNGLNIVMKDFLPIMAKLYKEAAITGALPSLNMSPEGNLPLWVNLPKRNGDKLKVTLFSNYIPGLWRSKAERRMYPEESPTQQLSWKSPQPTGSSAEARVVHCPSQPRGEIWVSGVTSGQRAWTPISPYTNWLSCNHTPPGRLHPYGTFLWEAAEEVS